MREVKIPDKVREGMQNLLAQKASIESSLQMYMKGCADTLDLDGDWNLDTAKWVMTKMPKPPKEATK